MPRNGFNLQAAGLSRQRQLMSVRILATVMCSLSAFTAHTASLTIYELEDVKFGETIPTTSRLRQRTSFCVSMEPRGVLRLIAVGTANNGEFAINAPGVAEEIGYSVRIQGRRLRPGVPINLQGQPVRPNGRCQQRQMIVEINQGELTRAPAGEYRGTLQLTIAPE